MNGVYSDPWLHKAFPSPSSIISPTSCSPSKRSVILFKETLIKSVGSSPGAKARLNIRHLRTA